MESTSDPTADKLVSVYIKIRDARKALADEFTAADERLAKQIEAVETALLDICRRTGQDGGKTAHGTFTRTVRTRYWPSDWARMHEFILKHRAPELLEKRISQTAMKEFLEANPDKLPEGLNADAAYTITVRRKAA